MFCTAKLFQHTLRYFMYDKFVLQATAKHHPILINLLCQELDIQPAQILDFELCLADTQPAVSIILKLW